MAETLTVDTTPDTETAVESLTPDEQESLEIGEQMAAEQEGLLAGKYKNAEELERAYKELESKLGSKDETSEEEEVSEEEPYEETESSPGVALISEASAEYTENGEITPETMAKFSQMSSSDLVEAYMEIQSQVGDQDSAPSADLSDADVNSIKNYAGGEDSYNQMIDWAQSNLQPESVEAFDSIINTGSIEAIKLAVSGLQSQFQNANGYEVRMLSGKAPKTSGDVFRSQAEVVEAMSDPRYDKDPAYRQDLIEKLGRSDVQF